MTNQLKLPSKTFQLFRAVGLLFSLLLVSGCNGPGDPPPCSRSEDACVVEPPPPVEIWWDAPSPDFSENQDRPTINLLGARTLLLTLGDTYLEAGEQL